MRVYQRALTRIIAQKIPSTSQRSSNGARVMRCCTSSHHNGVASANDVQRNNVASPTSYRAMSNNFSPSILRSATNNISRQQTNLLGSSSTVASFSSAATVDEEDAPQTNNFTTQRRQGIRNVAIVAHVDHGKTTLVDELLKAAASSMIVTTETESNNDNNNNSSDDNAEVEEERLMDSGELEIERGITITSKVTRLEYTSLTSSTNVNSIINVVDTPGHADFAGEVDRILSTVDGIVLVVDAGEGPKSQTKYVLSRALSLGLVPIVVLNKADRMESLGRLESGETEMALMDLFENLDATSEQMEYRTLFGSARGGWVTDDVDVALKIAQMNESGTEIENGAMCMRGLLDAILEDIPAPSVHWYGDASEEGTVKEVGDFVDEPFSMTANTVGYDPYLGRTCTGRIYSGQITSGDAITLLKRQNDEATEGDESSPTSNTNATGPTSQVSGVFANRGVSRMPLDPPIAHAGDIVTLTGVPESMKVGDTLTTTKNMVPRAVDTIPLAPPTLSCLFGANNGPLSGLEGQHVSSSKVRARLISETDNNVTITVAKCESDAEKTVLFGRGELQIGILVEQMRREGYEMIITPPQILTTICKDTGVTLEPYEEVIVDVDAEYSGTVVNALTGSRKGVLVEMSDDSKGKTGMKFEVPSRGLLGFGPEIATATRGTAVMHHCYLEDREHAGAIGSASDQGKLVSNAQGKTTLFALESLSSRGTLFVGAGDMVYPGMVIGENNKTGDLEVNPVRAKQLNNMRTQNKEDKLYLSPPKRMSVEELIGYMNEDEVIEVTPLSVRLRKLELDSGVRERAARKRKKQMDALKAQTSKGAGKKK
eukprot:CAMPEP_0172311224 /NCGR_PEP_ID=MMETSP1058-20130122/14209_1 /TAXON_ID=83371 /ORGANISM="Detonula confervacea, Strain CCMP 353" /LENGTH=827 /DNA_ID=CAMNT_0013024339 /DNA_START=75 /DNA_END=2558 /DNA_ORIENTATION=-